MNLKSFFAIDWLLAKLLRRLLMTFGYDHKSFYWIGGSVVVTEATTGMM